MTAKEKHKDKENEKGSRNETEIATNAGEIDLETGNNTNKLGMEMKLQVKNIKHIKY